MKMAQNSDNSMEILQEYEFDYTKAKPNRFAQDTLTVTLELDVAQVFNTSEAVNKALRAILTAIPKTVIYSKA
ncbi:conserved hypothetical protein [Beggiatoa sp. PS]|nr:conserved hypothetical protein [Beggiatoa sp. PS]